MNKLLLDTHLLLWSLYDTARLSSAAAQTLVEYADRLCFSSVSLVEIAIKQRTGKLGIQVDLPKLRATLLSMNTPELALTSEHAFVLVYLPLIHRDPFDRMLIAQSIVSGAELLTADKLLLQYPARIRYVG